ncbi:MAG: hypothetical protein R2754_18980 [Microthrixaceae bacterium]
MSNSTLRCRALGVALVILVVGCGGGESTQVPAATSEASPDGPTATPQSMTSSTTSTSDSSLPAKPGTGVSAQVVLSNDFVKVGEAVGFDAQFTAAAPAETSTFAKQTTGVATLDAELPDGLVADGAPTSFAGTVAASGNGSGMAQIGVEVTRNGRVQETRLTVFAEADLGYVAFGDSSESATRRVLADGLLEANVIDEAAHAERIAAIEGGSG